MSLSGMLINRKRSPILVYDDKGHMITIRYRKKRKKDFITDATEDDCKMVNQEALHNHQSPIQQSYSRQCQNLVNNYLISPTHYQIPLVYPQKEGIASGTQSRQQQNRRIFNAIMHGNSSSFNSNINTSTKIIRNRKISKVYTNMSHINTSQEQPGRSSTAFKSKSDGNSCTNSVAKINIGGIQISKNQYTTKSGSNDNQNIHQYRSIYHQDKVEPKLKSKSKHKNQRSPVTHKNSYKLLKKINIFNQLNNQINLSVSFNDPFTLTKVNYQDSTSDWSSHVVFMNQVLATNLNIDTKNQAKELDQEKQKVKQKQHSIEVFKPTQRHRVKNNSTTIANYNKGKIYGKIRSDFNNRMSKCSFGDKPNKNLRIKQRMHTWNNTELDIRPQIQEFKNTNINKFPQTNTHMLNSENKAPAEQASQSQILCLSLPLDPGTLCTKSQKITLKNQLQNFSLTRSNAQIIKSKYNKGKYKSTNLVDYQVGVQQGRTATLGQVLVAVGYNKKDLQNLSNIQVKHNNIAQSNEQTKIKNKENVNIQKKYQINTNVEANQQQESFSLDKIPDNTQIQQKKVLVQKQPQEKGQKKPQGKINLGKKYRSQKITIKPNSININASININFNNNVDGNLFLNAHDKITNGKNNNSSQDINGSLVSKNNIQSKKFRYTSNSFIS